MKHPKVKDETSERGAMLHKNRIDSEGELREKCPICKFKVRGPNHEKGDHHRGMILKKRR